MGRVGRGAKHQEEGDIMGKVEDALRDLIQYHGRRAARDVMGGIPDQVRELRSAVRDLQTDVENLQDKVDKLMEDRRERMTVPPAPEDKVEESRVTRRTLKSIRKRFDLTQDELAELLEVSPGTITLWETGKTRPRDENAARIITLRNMDKEVVDEALGRSSVETGFTPDEIRRLRGKLGVTQREMAERMGVSPASITNWERGETQPGRQSRRALQGLQEEIREGQMETDRETGEGMSPGDIRALREKLGLSQVELAEQLGVSAPTVSNWETGTTRPRPANLAQLRELAVKE